MILRYPITHGYGPYSASAATEPQGPPSGQYRVCRGGSWGNVDSTHFRTAYRGRGDPGLRIYDLGFRCARGSE